MYRSYAWHSSTTTTLLASASCLSERCLMWSAPISTWSTVHTTKFDSMPFFRPYIHAETVAPSDSNSRASPSRAFPTRLLCRRDSLTSPWNSSFRPALPCAR